MNDKFRIPITPEEIFRMMERFQAENPDRNPVAAVARPDLYQEIAILCKSEAWPGARMAFAFGLRVYSDAQQKEPWKLFYDWEELKAYLNRAPE